MRILNVTESYAPFYEFGGPPVKVEALSRGLAERGHEVTVLTADWGVEERFGKSSEAKHFVRSGYGWRGEDHGVTAIYLPTWLRYRATSWNPAIGSFLRNELSNFAAVHIFGLYDLLGPAVARACRRRKTPYVVEPIGMFVPIVRNVLLKRVYHELYGKKMLAGAARIIATAEQEMRELTEGGIPVKKVVLRRNGVLRPVRLPAKGLFRESKAIPDESLLVLFLGRLSEKKSPELLLRALSALPSRIEGRTLQLVFAGPDEHGMEAKLKELAAGLQMSERVKFTGPVFGEEKWAAYQDADVFVLPSQNENFGNTAAESAAVGTPVIVTENCGIAPLLAEGGIVIRHDERALTEALKKLLENRALRTELGQKAAIAAAKIGWDEPVRETESLYRELAEKR
jgi:glycosyltransferase involved in cell wall biosynthesis